MGQWGHYHLVPFFVCCICLLPYSICCDRSGPVHNQFYCVPLSHTTGNQKISKLMQLATEVRSTSVVSCPVAGFVWSWKLDFKTLIEMPAPVHT